MIESNNNVYSDYFNHSYNFDLLNKFVNRLFMKQCS